MTPAARGMLQAAAATAVFGVAHSLLASSAAKRRAAELIGERNRDGLYRLFFNAQAAATTGLLAGYVATRPGRELYRAHGPARLVLRAGQVVSAGMMAAAVREVGFGEISGLSGVADRAAGRPIRAEPEAQGPSERAGRLRTGGPFRLCRHPLNFWSVPLLWLSPRMTTTLAAFNVAATAYFVLGSAREDDRLAATFGREYEVYRGEVPFFVPKLPSGGREPRTAGPPAVRDARRSGRPRPPVPGMPR